MQGSSRTGCIPSAWSRGNLAFGVYNRTTISGDGPSSPASSRTFCSDGARPSWRPSSVPASFARPSFWSPSFWSPSFARLSSARLSLQASSWRPSSPPFSWRPFWGLPRRLARRRRRLGLFRGRWCGSWCGGGERRPLHRKGIHPPGARPAHFHIMKVRHLSLPFQRVRGVTRRWS